MSRPLRIAYEGAWYHVMNRGRRSEPVFEGRNDYRLFIDLLKDVTRLWDVRIAAYCLMPNHYHMIIHTPRGNISRCMRHIDGVYTQRFNRSHNFDGPLFRGRFKSILIDADRYLLQLVRYLHKNPVKAGMAGNPEQYPWSSHRGYCSASKEWDWLYKDFVLSLLTGEKGRRMAAYRRFMAEDDSEEMADLFKRQKWPVFLGDESFVERLRGRFFERKRHPQIPESGELAPGVEAIKKIVSRYYGVEESVLMKSRRGRFNEPRCMAIYLDRMLRKDSLTKISSDFGFKGYSSASSVLQGFEKRIRKNRRLRERHEKLWKALIIGQTET